MFIPKGKRPTLTADQLKMHLMRPKKPKGKAGC